jgi:hypothetical protein
VTELLTSTGTQEQNGATTFFLAHRSPDRVTDTVCKVFLGIQLQCAQCHNHPYTGWKRAEYWGMAAFFAKVDDGATAKLSKAKSPNVREASTILTKRLPASALKTPPKFLEGAAPTLDSKEPYRPVLAQWLTSTENPYFAKAMVNRLWAQYFGRGLVNPVDNLMKDNPPSHPELFETLAQQFIRSGPSQKDTFDMKPGTKNAGEFQPMATSVPGIQISEHFPKFAQQMQHAAILRSMTTPEGGHARAKYYMHTGYREGLGGLTYPSLGAITSAELGAPDFPLPNFVSVGNSVYGAGFLGVRHQPLIVTDPNRGVANLAPLDDMQQFGKRIGLLEDLEAGFARTKKAQLINDHQTIYRRTVRLMRSKEAKAFDLSREPAASRAAYGGSKFGDGCLLARRLVEVGIPFVEVFQGGWDTHANNFPKVKELSREVDPAMSTLIADLKSRGLLDSTLVIWMGEFGRHPAITSKNGQTAGRQHYPRAWTTVLVGGGIKGGQVIGKTDKEGADIIEKPISGLDFLASVCKILGIDYTKQNQTPIGRPIRIVDKGAKVVEELLS